MPPHFPNIEEHQGKPLWYIVQILSWRTDAVQTILEKIERIEQKDFGNSTYSPKVLVNELKEVLEMFEHRKKFVEAKDTQNE